jgi:hypothetical protein
MSLDDDALTALRGATLIATDTEVGEIEEVYAQVAEDRPPLALVSAEAGPVLVPLGDDADIDTEDEVVTVPFAPDVVESAPSPAGEALTDDELDAAYEHYGLADAELDA